MLQGELVPFATEVQLAQRAAAAAEEAADADAMPAAAAAAGNPGERAAGAAPGDVEAAAEQGAGAAGAADLDARGRSNDDMEEGTPPDKQGPGHERYRDTHTKKGRLNQEGAAEGGDAAG